MSGARNLYQFPLIEIALVAAFITQIALGIKLLAGIKKRERKDGWHTAQFVSACYLAYFIVQHTAPAIITRLGFGLDTNFYWTARSFAFTPLKFWFAAYYLLAVIALVGHLIAALHYQKAQSWHAPSLAVEPILGALFVAGYGGAFAVFDLPQDYRDYYAFLPGIES